MSPVGIPPASSATSALDIQGGWRSEYASGGGSVRRSALGSGEDRGTVTLICTEGDAGGAGVAAGEPSWSPSMCRGIVTARPNVEGSLEVGPADGGSGEDSHHARTRSMTSSVVGSASSSVGGYMALIRSTMDS